MLFNLKPLNTIAITTMLLGLSLLIFFCYIFIDFPSSSPAITSSIPIPLSQSQTISQQPQQSDPDPFDNLLDAYKKWDSQMGCVNFKRKNLGLVKKGVNLSSLQVGNYECSELKMNHVGVLVNGWTWIPDNLDNLYNCRCGLSCLWTKSNVLLDKPDALFFETTTPPSRVLCLNYFFCKFQFGILKMLLLT